MSVFKRSLVLLYSFKQSYSVIRAYFLMLQFFFSCFVLQNQYTIAECSGAVDVIRKRSGEMRESLCHFLDSRF